MAKELQFFNSKALVSSLPAGVCMTFQGSFLGPHSLFKKHLVVKVVTGQQTNFNRFP